MPRVLFCVTMCGAVPGAKQPLDFTSPRHLSKSDNRDVARGSARQPWLQMCMGRQVTVDMFHDAMVLFT
jgi:hypothetical protein